jgi:hypothetical protein
MLTVLRKLYTDKVSFRNAGRNATPVHSRKRFPIVVYHGSRVRDSEPPCRRTPCLCGVGVRDLDRAAWSFGYVSSRRRWSLASISSNCEKHIHLMRPRGVEVERRLTLVPSGSGMVRQMVLSSTSRIIMPSSTSFSVTLTVLQLTSSRAGKG